MHVVESVKMRLALREIKCEFKPFAFAPIQNIDGYISALRHNGESEERLAEIRAKHTLPPPPPPKPPTWTPRVKFLDQVAVTLKVKGESVKVSIVAPFDEFRKYTGKPVPLAVRVRAFKLNGAPDEVLKDMIRTQNTIESKKHQKKITKWLEKMNHKAPAKKVLKSVKKKIIPK